MSFSFSFSHHSFGITLQLPKALDAVNEIIANMNAQIAPYALNRRAGSAIYDIIGSTSNVPGSSKRNYEIAADEFAPILEEVKAIKAEFEKMDQKLGTMNAPLTKGRLPNWSK